MSALEEILQLPLHEKLIAFEAIWNDISKNQESIEIPDWHKEILDERESQIEQGAAKFLDWELAKNQIRKATS